MSASTRPRALFPRANTAAEILALGEEGLKRLHRHHRPVQQQGEERHRDLPPPARAARRRGAAGPRGAGSPARRRSQDRQRGAEHRLRPADDRGRHPHLPRRQPHRAGPRQGPCWRVEKGLLKRGAGRVPARCPPLADPARPLRLQGAKAALPDLRDPRPVPLSGQDARRVSLGFAGRESFCLATPSFHPEPAR
jgi:hypothetical protein